MNSTLAVAVLISGRGSNLKSLIDGQQHHPYRIIGVASNRADAAGLEFARQAGIQTLVVDHREFADRASFDMKLADALDSWQPGLLVLAGFMRILGDGFVHRFEGRMINIHPSLLPRYPGLDTHQRALDAGDQWHGASTHFVTNVLDGGPVIAQTRIAIRPDDNAEKLADRLLQREHRLMVQTVDLLARGEVQFLDDHIYHHNQPLQQPLEPSDPLD
jgi:phosphoribosylglycinamide formyltransferase-1